ncbi:MAG: DNA methyltransferase, partial [bacterium]|nr:DNA methyltransferase [bacterium]
QNLFGRNVFDYSKPISLLSVLLSQICVNDGLVLDFFAGSAVTAHAVLELNKQDGGNRKFIMVQLPEPCDENSEAFKAGYKTIAEIGKERIRRVIRKTEEEQTSGQPSLFDSDKPKLDLGFKVLKLDRSNFKVWDGSEPDVPDEELLTQIEMHIDHIDQVAGAEDLLYELLLKRGFKPTDKIEKREMAGKTVYSVADGNLFICLEDEITRELIDAVTAAEPQQFICLDLAFRGNDQLKTNTVQTFRARGAGRDSAEEIGFLTV